MSDSRRPRPVTTAKAITPVLPNRLRRMSRWMVRACWALLLLLPAGLLAYAWVGTDELLLRHANLSAHALLAPLSDLQRAGAGVLLALPLGFLLVGIWNAKTCFGRFAQGQVFTLDAVVGLRRVAGWVAAAALAALLCSMAASVVLTLHHPAGQRMLALGVGSNHLVTLFFAALVWVMADVIGQGQKLAEDNAGFV
ncbi:MAG: DUF2975 domain-containing protein [Burkholderiales bacterium]|nr:MAG: DUF2975 domain-containing protein [Burkholderiales bacterium]